MVINRPLIHTNGNAFVRSRATMLAVSLVLIGKVRSCISENLSRVEA